ncbi:MAG: FCD domain-containing protein [Anaerolineae bacterium]|nr:FCD domain-containing protein [Anaerolineae bacterium]MDW8098076.1 FCD domain-containing protein [Anaerolineae bacterium]
MKGSNNDADTALRAKKLHELLAERLEELILKGVYLPGQSLPSAQALAAQYGVSQTVVRDAIRGLAAKGLVQARHGVGVFVTDSAHANLMDSARLALLRGKVTPREIWEVRRIFEVEVAALAAARRTEEDLQYLRQVLADYKAAAGVEPWEKTFQYHLRFHLALIKAVHNRALTILMEPITEFLIVSAQREDPGESAMRTYQQHEHIFSFIEAGDVEGARQAMLEHFVHPWAWDINPPRGRKEAAARSHAEPEEKA